MYRTAAEALVGAVLVEVVVADPAYVRGGSAGVGPALAIALRGSVVVAARRRGKVAILEFDNGHSLGLRFGMTGRLVVGDHDPIGRLEYSSGRDDPSWDRFTAEFRLGAPTRDGTARSVLRLNDPRRLGSVELDPDLGRLGPNAEEISVTELAQIMAADRPIKAVLLDQHRIAGLGNLLCDETLWRCGIDPGRVARRLDPEELEAIRSTIVEVVGDLAARGGSHRGELQAHRVAGGRCPTDGTPLLRRKIAGRTTYSCPAHQPHGS